MSTSDDVVRSQIATARLRTLAWLDAMQAPGMPRGVSRISDAHAVEDWPGMLLPGTYNSVLCRALLEGATYPDTIDRDAVVDWLLGHRRADGVFRIPGMMDEDVYKKPDAAETWRYIDFHVTNYALGAVDALSPGVVPVLDFAKPYLDVTTLKAWLCDRDLRDPWQEGNNVVNLGGFLFALAGGQPMQVSAALVELFAWHDRLQEPTTGFWGLNQTDPIGGLHAMAGSMHNFHLYYATGRKLPYHDRAIDYALARPTGPDSACIDVDLVDLLVQGQMLNDHRADEVVAWLRAKLVALLSLQQPDGGFYDEPTGIRRQDGWVRGYCETQGISNTFATWFRWIAIAMIADLIWPGCYPWKFRSGVGIGYRMERKA